MSLIAWGEENYKRIKKIDGIFCRMDTETTELLKNI